MKGKNNLKERIKKDFNTYFETEKKEKELIKRMQKKKLLKKFKI